MSSVAFKHVPLFVNHTPKKDSLGEPLSPHKCSRKDLHYDVSNVFRKHITDTEKISPYESPAFSNYPGGSNLIYLPSDIYNSAKTFYRSIKEKDREGAEDSFTRLVGAPANFISAGGSVINYGIALNIIPAAHFVALVPLSYAFGVILCTVEGIVDSISLAREQKFVNAYNFDILAKLDKLVRDFNPQESTKALKELTTLLNENPEDFEHIFGKEQMEQIRDLFNKIQKEVELKPLHYRQVLKKYAPALAEISRHLLIAKLGRLQREYLELSPKEVMEICEKTEKKFKNSKVPMSEQLEYLEEKLNKALTVKKRNLARRVRPWMVDEASLKTVSLLKGLVDNDPKAIDEALSLSNDINTQTWKKTLVHVLGILALIVAAASLITLIAGCAMVIPYVLIGVATAIALVRMIAYTTTLDTLGWNIDWKALLPNCLKSKKEEEERLKKLKEEMRLKDIYPLDQTYHKVKHEVRLNPQAMKV